MNEMNNDECHEVKGYPGSLLPNQYLRLEELLRSAASLSTTNRNCDITVSVIFRDGYPRTFGISSQERCVVPDGFKKNFSHKE